MEVIKARATLLTNQEVLSLLKEVGDAEKRKSKANRLQKLSTIVYETTRYLEQTPAATQDADCIKSFLEAVKKYNLTRAESLMMVNLRPTTPVEVQLIVEECEERLTEDQVDELAQLVIKHLPPAPGTDTQQTSTTAPSASLKPE
uniref:DNA-directed RNA polymerase III subunit RPC9 n=1 Tax=Plectus sambesii TaxID=2011161 RepID=A0A914VGW6_9BILA